MACQQRRRYHQLQQPLICCAHQQRFFLPTTPIAGARFGMVRASITLQVLGSFGEPGIFEGVRVPGFQTAGGSTATLGAQWSPAAALDTSAVRSSTRTTSHR